MDSCRYAPWRNPMKLGAAYGKKWASVSRSLVIRVIASSLWRCRLDKSSCVKIRIGVGDVFIKLADTEGLFEPAEFGLPAVSTTVAFFAGRSIAFLPLLGGRALLQPQ